MKTRAIALLLITLTLCSFSLKKLSRLDSQLQRNSGPEMLYLPSGQGIEFISFGFRNTLAHFLWFQANNYFGKHYRADRNYEWLSHYCKLVSTLNPKNRDYYQFCGTMLAWEANKTQESIDVFSRAIEAYPDDWFFYYLRGFTYAFFAQDDEKAKADFVKSATLPNAHYFVARLAARKMLNSGNVDDAREFLKEAIEMAADPNTKSILQNRLRQIESSSPDAIKAIPSKRFSEIPKDE